MLFDFGPFEDAVLFDFRPFGDAVLFGFRPFEDAVLFGFRPFEDAVLFGFRPFEDALLFDFRPPAFFLLALGFFRGSSIVPRQVAAPHRQPKICSRSGASSGARVIM